MIQNRKKIAVIFLHVHGGVGGHWTTECIAVVWKIETETGQRNAGTPDCWKIPPECSLIEIVLLEHPYPHSNRRLYVYEHLR